MSARWVGLPAAEARCVRRRVKGPMSTQRLSDLVLQLVAPVLAPFGFVRAQQTFRKELGDQCWMVHLSFVRHREDVDVICDFAVRHHAIQDLLRPKRYAKISDREFRTTATVGTELGNYLGQGQRRWSIREPADVAAFVTDFQYCFSEHILHGLEALSELTQLQEALERGDAWARLICPLPGQATAVLEAIRSHRAHAPSNQRLQRRASRG